MPTMPKSGITYEQLAGAYLTRLLSEEAFLTLCALVEDTQALSRLSTARPSLMTCKNDSGMDGGALTSLSDRQPTQRSN